MNDEARQAVSSTPMARRGAWSWWPFVAVVLTPPVLLVLVAGVDDKLVGVVSGASGTSALLCGFCLARRLYAKAWWGIQLFMAVVFSVLLLVVSIVLWCIGFTLGGGELIPHLHC